MESRLVLFTGMLFLGVITYAQAPVSWSYFAKHVGPQVYEIHLLAKMRQGYHIYAQRQPKSAAAIPTSITINKSPLLSLRGTTGEKGQIVHFRNDQIGVAQDQYSDSVEFVQLVKLKAPVRTTVSGVITYMACTDKQCMPAATVDFSIPLPLVDPER
jgi:DsbC/DsbD-like thiol-disulfide interchange protein